MGCKDNITFDKFPKQADENYKYPRIGKRVKVCYHYDTSKCHYGRIIRDDIEDPYELIILLDNGRIIRGEECQYAFVEDEKKGQLKMDRKLDGIYFRVKRGDKWENVCFSDLTLKERIEIGKDRSGEWWKSLAYHLADCLKDIGDKFNIVCE